MCRFVGINAIEYCRVYSMCVSFNDGIYGMNAEAPEFSIEL